MRPISLKLSMVKEIKIQNDLDVLQGEYHIIRLSDHKSLNIGPNFHCKVLNPESPDSEIN